MKFPLSFWLRGLSLPKNTSPVKVSFFFSLQCHKGYATLWSLRVKRNAYGGCLSEAYVFTVISAFLSFLFEHD